jgi:hypothetical protein
MKTMIRLLSGLGLLSIAVAARAATLTYVDATPDTGPETGNTKIFHTVSGMPVLGNPQPNVDYNYATTTNSATDNFWQYRNLTGTNQVNGSFLWQTDANAAGESTEALVTTLSGLTVGQKYVVYVAFFGGQQATSNWDIAGRLGDTGPFTLFKHRVEPIPDTLGDYVSGALGIDTTADGSEFTNSSPVVQTRAFSVTPAQSHLLLGKLGTVTIGESGATSVYIQGPDVDVAGTFERRTYYEGLVYELAPIPGDFDGDRDVDGADFVAWQTNFPLATGATLAQGDADADGDVDGADFVVWQTNFPTTPSPSSSPVPEPGGIWLGTIGLVALITAKLSLYKFNDQQECFTTLFWNAAVSRTVRDQFYPTSEYRP